MTSRNRFFSNITAAIAICFFSSSANAQLKIAAPQQLSTVTGNPTTPPDDDSGQVVLAPDSDYAIFQSRATNLLGDGKDTNGASDIFLKKRGSSTVTRLSVTDNEEETRSESSDFPPDSLYPGISPLLPDGTFGVTFVSGASNLLPAGVTNPNFNEQLYLRIPDPKNPSLGKTVLITRGFNGTDAGNGDTTKSSITALSGPNRFLVVFSSRATNLLEIPKDQGDFLSRVYLAEVNISGPSVSVKISGGANGPIDGELYDPVISGDGRYVVCTHFPFTTNPPSQLGPIPQILRFNIARRRSEIISLNEQGEAGNGSSREPSISFSGDKVAFSTEANNLGVEASASQPKFVLWRESDRSLELVSKTNSGVVGNGSYSFQEFPNRPTGMLSADGRFAIWSDTANNLVDGDTNGVADVFLKDLSDGSIQRVSKTSSDGELDARSIFPVIGRSSLASTELRMAFETRSSNIGTFFLNPQFQANVARVFISTGSFPAPIIEQNAPIQTPPDIKVSGTTVTLNLIKFKLPKIGKLDSVSNSESNSQHSLELATKSTITYELQLARAGSKKRIKVIATKNRVTIRALPPGTYQVKYRAIATVGKKKPIFTKFSPVRKFIVKK